MKNKRLTEEKFRVSVYFSTHGEAQSFKDLLLSCNYNNAELTLITTPYDERKRKLSEVLDSGREH